MTVEIFPVGTLDILMSEIASIKEMLSQKTKQEDSEELISRKEAKELLGVTDVTIWNWSKQGKLKTYKIGGKVFLFRSEVMELVKGNLTKK